MSNSDGLLEIDRQIEVLRGASIRHNAEAFLASNPGSIAVMGATLDGVLSAPNFANTEVTVINTWQSLRMPERFMDGWVPAGDAKRPPTREVELGRDYRLPLGDGSVDQLVLSNYFGAMQCHYVAESNRVFSEATRVIRPGGYLVSLAHGSSISSVQDALNGWPYTEQGEDHSWRQAYGNGLILGLERHEADWCVDVFNEVMANYGLAGVGGNATFISPFVMYLRKNSGEELMNENELAAYAKEDEIREELEKLYEQSREMWIEEQKAETHPVQTKAKDIFEKGKAMAITKAKGLLARAKR
jgi:hypothetical protein